MDEFIREVDEEYRRQRINEIWQRYNALIIGIAVLVVASVGGWRYWQYHELQRSEAASTQFETALQLSRDGKTDDAEKALSTLASGAPQGYRLLARFRLAAEQGRADPEAGAKAYDAISSDSGVDGNLRDLARLRGSMLRLDREGGNEAARVLEQLASPTNTWRHTAREMLGLAALRRGDGDGASRWFDQMAADRDTPAGIRSRLEIYTALAAGGPVQITQ